MRGRAGRQGSVNLLNWGTTARERTSGPDGHIREERDQRGVIEKCVGLIETLVCIDQIHDLGKCIKADSERKLPVGKCEPMTD